MSRIADVFARLRTERSGALIPYICAGDPDPTFTGQLMRRLSQAGADIIELGIPFSDPVADGPVIQRAMARSLSSGFKPKDAFGLISSAREDGVDQPIVVMTYFNPILRMGIEKFCSSLRDAGGDGVLVVDLPPEESTELDRFSRSNGLDIIRLVAPSTNDERIGFILKSSSGFVYAVSVAGTTGVRESIPPSATDLIHRVKRQTDLPVALGFGISKPSHVREALRVGADAVVEGSKLVSIYSEAIPDRRRALESVASHALEMKSATRSQP